MVPEGWRRIPLERVAEVRTGLAKNSAKQGDIIELPYLRVANVQDGYLDLSEVKTIQVERSKVERYRLKDGDVLMTEGGDFDKLGRGDVWRNELPCCLHQNHVFAVRPNQSELLPYFLAALAASNYGRTYFLNSSKRTTNLASINSTQLKSFPIPLPPLSEQQKIAEILSTWDESIATTEKLLENSRRRQTTLREMLLNTGRESGHVRRIRDVADIDTASLGDGTPQGFEFSYISLSDVGKRGIESQLARHRYEDSPSRARRLVSTGDILVSTVRPNLESFAVVEDAHDGSVASTGFAVLTPKHPEDSTYILSCLFTSYVRRQIHALVAGSNYPAITPKDVGNLRIYYPDSALREAASATFWHASEIIRTIENQLETLRQEKQALAQQLLSGKKRVQKHGD